MMYVIDASVILSSFFSGEPKHQAAKRFFDSVRQHKNRVVVPEIVHLEVASAIARVSGDRHKAEQFANYLMAIPEFTFVPLTREFVLQARAIAVHAGTRALDSCYLAVTRQYGLTLVTLDQEQAKRSPADIAVKSL